MFSRARALACALCRELKFDANALGGRVRAVRVHPPVLAGPKPHTHDVVAEAQGRGDIVFGEEQTFAWHGRESRLQHSWSDLLPVYKRFVASECGKR